MDTTENMRSVEESPNIAALAAALAKAQGAMENAAKDRENPHFRSKYADLASIWGACRAPLSANGLAVMQRVRAASGSVTVLTMLVHSSGEWVRDTCTLPVAQGTPQAYGSAVTYLRRYALAALVGVAADEDDDSNAASGPAQPPQKAKRKPEDSAPAKTAQAAPAPAQAPKEAKPEPKQSPQLRARIAKLWKTAQARGVTMEGFQAWAASNIGRQVASVDWTEMEVQRMEDAGESTTVAAANAMPSEPGEEG